ncbi:hypothetical protein FPOA_09020 [Fusarium poae]|uniref:Uncharacterized protein n=1 Tax=Fusarium poae TaxID=36050 RepID=A0A1B8AQ98_FUSPO|nr:hypothetical protein FPOA_09020 [Fusarium poae]
MQCSGWAQSRVISFDISNRPNAKDNDIVPSLNVYDTKHRAWHMLSWYGSSNDQRLDFTPRGLIVTAAAMCVNKKICGREFFTHVMQCPYEDMEQFIPCIHCYGVKETHIDDFERFIMNYKFGAADYADEKTPMQWSKYADNTCCATQLEIDDDDDDDSRFKEGKRTCQVLMAKDNGKSRHYRYTFTQTVDYRNDEAPTPKIPSDAGTRYEDETGPVPTAISATTRALDHREISSTTASPSENITSKQAINNVKILGVLSAVLNLFLV